MNTHIQKWLLDSAVRAATVASIFAILITFMLTQAFFRAKTLDNSISVTGSARKTVVSDTAKLSITVRRVGTFNNLSQSYKIIDKNTETVKAFIIQSGFTEKDITITTASADQVYTNADKSIEQKEFDMRQYITITSQDMSKIENISRSITGISEPGLIIEVRPVEYLYTKLADIRADLFAEAIKDAQVRAKAIASTSGGKVGKIKSAATGVIQVLVPKSVEVSDYGTVDTTSKEKEVMVTARASFYLK
jgi:hypothetical protein